MELLIVGGLLTYFAYCRYGSPFTKGGKSSTVMPSGRDTSLYGSGRLNRAATYAASRPGEYQHLVYSNAVTGYAPS
jgi:hypothetical protein